MVIISTPLSTIPVATGVEEMGEAGPRVLPAPLPAAGMVSPTMAGAAAGMVAAVAMPVVVTGSPGSRALIEVGRHPIEAGLRRIEAGLRPIAGEDSVKVKLTV
jgi:hypothetical protein